MRDVYAPESLERYYKMRSEKGASEKAEPSSKKLKVDEGEAAKPDEEVARGLLGRSVSVRLLDGSVVRGELVKVSRYELLLRTEVGQEVVLFKHAAAYILPASAL